MPQSTTVVETSREGGLSSRRMSSMPWGTRWRTESPRSKGPSVLRPAGGEWRSPPPVAQCLGQAAAEPAGSTARSGPSVRSTARARVRTTNRKRAAYWDEKEASSTRPGR